MPQTQIQNQEELMLKDCITGFLATLIEVGAVFSEDDVCMIDELNEILEKINYRIVVIRADDSGPSTLALIHKTMFPSFEEDRIARTIRDPLHRAIIAVPSAYESLLNAFVCAYNSSHFDPLIHECKDKYYVIDIADKLLDMQLLTEQEYDEITEEILRKYRWITYNSGDK